MPRRRRGGVVPAAAARWATPARDLFYVQIQISTFHNFKLSLENYTDISVSCKRRRFLWSGVIVKYLMECGSLHRFNFVCVTIIEMFDRILH